MNANHFEPVRLILTYDVIDNNMEEYYKFVLGEYLPMMEEMGWKILDAWSVSYGDAPDRHFSYIAEDRQTVSDLLETNCWTDLNEKLEKYVTNFNYKLVEYREGFQF